MRLLLHATRRRVIMGAYLLSDTPGGGAVDTPDMFIRAADWAHAREYGCPAGLALRRVLLELTGPPRLGACTLDAPVPLPAWPVREVTVRWPVTTTAVDAVLLIHPGPLPAAVRARLTAGPQHFHVLPVLPADPPEVPLVDVRARLLAGELHALAARHPAVARELRGIAGPAVLTRPRPRVAVIGPEPAEVDLPGMEIVTADPHVDVVLAVAPSGGWRAADHPTLRDAARRAGRLVSTAPLPADVLGTVVLPGQSPAAAVRHALSLPAALPAPRPGAWLRAADQLERRRRLLLDVVPHTDLPALARRHGLSPAAPPPPWEVLTQALFLATVAALTLGRALWFLGPVPGLLAGTAAGLLAGGMRWRTGRREAQRRWIRQETTRILRTPPAEAAWLRRQLAKET